MNDCQSVREWLSAYLDGEIDSRRREAVEGHLAGCDVCRRELASLRGVSACLQAWPAPEAAPELSAHFTERLAERTRQNTAHHPFAIPWFRAAWASGLAACLALGVFVYLREGTPPRTPDETPASIVSRGGNEQPVDNGKPAAGNDNKAVVVTPAVVASIGDNPVPRAHTRIAHRRPPRHLVAKLPEPVIDIVVEKYEAEDTVLDPALTAMNALTETPIAPPEDAFVYTDVYANEKVIGYDEDGRSLPVEEHYEHQPAALAFALLAEAP